MHKLYELKDMLCEELEQYGKKGELTAGSLDVVDKLTHTIKNLDKIIEKYEEDEYSNAMGGGSYARGGQGGGQSNTSYARGGSYARGRGSNARRDSMGRYSSEGGYSRNDGMIMELRELMQDAPDERTRQEFERFIQKMEMM
jgi:hypothetical protein